VTDQLIRAAPIIESESSRHPKLVGGGLYLALSNTVTLADARKIAITGRMCKAVLYLS
jgi:hypothetical protein